MGSHTDIASTATTSSANPAAEWFLYSLGPFQFRSLIELPELQHCPVPGRFPVTISFLPIPDTMPGAVRVDRWVTLSATEFLLSIPKAGRFYVANGQDVRVEPDPDVAPPDLRIYLLGSVFGALCHQNGMLPLHASAIEHNGCFTAFLGESGAGKSTMAACLQRRGYRIVCDDICLFEPAADSGRMQVVPVAGWLKLWRTSLDHLGESPVEDHRVLSTDDKYRLYLGSQFGSQETAQPALANLIFLARSQSPGEAPRMEPLTTVETMANMMAMVYMRYLVEANGSRTHVFQQCAQILSEGARGFRLTVPWGFEQMDSVLDLLEEAILRPTGPR